MVHQDYGTKENASSIMATIEHELYVSELRKYHTPSANVELQLWRMCMDRHFWGVKIEMQNSMLAKLC